jgi:hypothetical protein
VRDYLKAADTAGAPRTRLVGRDAEEIARLWNELPPGEQARCHVPPFGLRLFSRGVLLLEASLCWDCNNIFGVAGESAFGFEFDASAPSSTALLARLREALHTTRSDDP